MGKHTSKKDKIVYCVEQSEYGRFESPTKIKPKEDGVGTFVWPNGLRTMCWFYDGSLLLSQTLSGPEQSQFELMEEKQKFEKYKIAEEEKLRVKSDEEKRQFEKYKEEQETSWKDRQQEEKAKWRKASEELEITRQEMKLSNEKWKENEEKQIQQQKDELEANRKAFEVEKAEGLIFVTHNKGPIKLNIGGTPFQTTHSSISKFSSMLSTMFSGRFEIEKDESGAVFIDRDGTYFRHILNFLRDGTLPTNLSAEVIEALLVEAEYYQMKELIQALNDLVSKK